LLAAELRKKGYVCRPIALGSNTDPYQPAERRLGITRAILEVLRDFRHPVTIVTKSALIRRDLDIIGAMAEDGLVRVMISLTTLDRDLARRMEPRAATPERRLETIAALAAAGVPAGVLAAPMIPALNDHEMEAILERARAAGAVSAAYTLLRLPYELKELFREWLVTHAPARAERVLLLVAAAHGGKLYDGQWSVRRVGNGPYAEMLQQRFARACRRLGFAPRAAAPLDTTRFRPPPQQGDQLELF
jgi:DNA repair photolyase